jgi:hypothetical protein
MSYSTRVFHLCFIGILAFLFCGCSSYLLASSLNRSTMSTEGHRARFYIKSVKLEGAAAGGAIHYSDYYSAVNLNEMLRYEYPAIFSNGRDAIPLEVDISISDSYTIESLAAYLTFGIAPGENTFYHDVRVMVSIDDSEFNMLLAENIEYRTIAIHKASTISPLGVIPPSASGINFEMHDFIKGSGTASITDSSAFFRRQLVSAIVIALQSADRDSLDLLYDKWQDIREARTRRLLDRLN